MGLGGFFFYYFAPAACPLLTLQTVACSSGKERGGNLGSGHLIPRRAPLPSRWWKWQNPTFFLLKQWGRQERKDSFRVMKVQNMKQEVLSCLLHTWCLLKSLLSDRVWVTSSALWKREIILFFHGFEALLTGILDDLCPVCVPFPLPSSHTYPSLAIKGTSPIPSWTLLQSSLYNQSLIRLGQ